MPGETPLLLGTLFSEVTADDLTLDAQADAFSYGVLLWELVTKEQTSRGNWRPVRVPEECPAAVEALISDCLTDDVERRPSMQDIVERLTAIADPPKVPAADMDSAKQSSSSDSNPPSM